MKTSLVSCLTSILLAASAFANYTVNPGLNNASRFILLANQLDQTGSGSDTLNDVLPPGCGVGMGDGFKKWDNVNHCYLPWSTFIGNQWMPNVYFNPTEAGFLFSAAAAVTIGGAAVTAPPCASFSFGPGVYMNGLNTPLPTKPEDIFCQWQWKDGDTMYRWLPSHQAWDTTVEAYYSGFGWDPPTTANVLPGEGVAYGDPPLGPGSPPTTGLHVYVWASYPLRLTTPCCGQQMTYYVVVVNWQPSVATNANVELVLDPTLITTSPPYPATPAFSSTAGVNWSAWAGNNQMIWTLPTLDAYQVSTIRLTVNVSGCTAPAVSTLNSSATLTAGTYVDTATHSVQTLCSHDPNDKAVTPHGCGPQGLIPANTDLTYVVQFQNTGTGPASQVVIRDTLHTNLDLSSFQMLASSHPYSLFVNGRQLIWTFTGINLPPASLDEPGSHGFVEFKVKQNADLSPGSVITNQAAIYFDANPVVLTVVTTNTITSSPVPVASFSVSQSNPRINTPMNFTYTGGTAGASYLWDFGSGAIPATSAAQNPTGVVYTTSGPKLPSLLVNLGGCAAEPALVRVNVAGFSPRLDVRQVGSQVELSWTDEAYHLQATPVLSSTSVWTNVPGAAPISLPIGPGMLFFRLVNP